MITSHCDSHKNSEVRVCCAFALRVVWLGRAHSQLVCRPVCIALQGGPQVLCQKQSHLVSKHKLLGASREGLCSKPHVPTLFIMKRLSSDINTRGNLSGRTRVSLRIKCCMRCGVVFSVETKWCWMWVWTVFFLFESVNELHFEPTCPHYYLFSPPFLCVCVCVCLFPLVWVRFHSLYVSGSGLPSSLTAFNQSIMYILVGLLCTAPLLKVGVTVSTYFILRYYKWNFCDFLFFTFRCAVHSLSVLLRTLAFQSTWRKMLWI